MDSFSKSNMLFDYPYVSIIYYQIFQHNVSTMIINRVQILLSFFPKHGQYCIPIIPLDTYIHIHFVATTL